MAALREVVAGDRRQPVTALHVELDGDYTGWWCDLDRDIDLGTQEDLTSGSVQRVADALARMVLAWNFAGKDGAALSADREGVRRITAPLLQALLEAFNRAVTVPNG